MQVTRRCPFTGQFNTMNINCTEQQLISVANGIPVQEVMPEVSAEQREFIMSGITPDVWDSMFGEFEDSDFDEDYYD